LPASVRRNRALALRVTSLPFSDRLYFCCGVIATFLFEDIFKDKQKIAFFP
jgi:hypothetical protein